MHGDGVAPGAPQKRSQMLLGDMSGVALYVAMEVIVGALLLLIVAFA